MRTIKYLVIHCTATPQRTTVLSILRYWRNFLGWKNPGYHFIIKPDGEVVELHPIERVANGVRGHNRHSIHIAYIGGVDRYQKPADNRTPHQIAAMRFLLNRLKKQFPKAEILGHRDFPGVNKACPSFDVKKWWASYNQKPKNMKHFLIAVLMLFTLGISANFQDDEKTDFNDVTATVVDGLQDIEYVTLEYNDHGTDTRLSIHEVGSEGFTLAGEAIGHGETLRTDTESNIYTPYADIWFGDFIVTAKWRYDRSGVRVRGVERSGKNLQRNHRVLSLEGDAHRDPDDRDRARSARIPETVSMAWIPSGHRPVAVRRAKNL